MAIYSSLEGGSNNFLDWLTRKGQEFMSMHTNNVSNGNPVSFAGAYALGQDSEDRGNLLEGNLQDSYDQSNTLSGYQKFSDLIKAYQSGEMSALDIQAYVAQNGFKLRPSEEAWLNSILAVDSTQSDRDYQTNMRDTAIESTYDQLQRLGLNPSMALSLGGTSSGVSSTPAKISPSDVAKMQFQRNTGMAQTLIRLAGGLASTGVHGAALGAAKFAAAKLTSEASRYATDSKYNSMSSSWFDADTHTFNKMYQKY